MRKFFRDKDGKVVVWQWPNLALWVWIVCTVLTKILPAGRIVTVLGLVAFGSLFIWAVLEIFQGASPFRRTLGAAVLIVSILNRIN